MATFVSSSKSGTATRMARLSVASSSGRALQAIRPGCRVASVEVEPVVASVMSTSVARPSSGSMSLTTRPSRSNRPTKLRHRGLSDPARSCEPRKPSRTVIGDRSEYGTRRETENLRWCRLDAA